MEEKRERIGYLEWKGRYLVIKEFGKGSELLANKEEFDAMVKKHNYKIVQ